MTDFVYFMKLLGVTLVLVLMLQINVGEHSLETHTMNWLQSSSLVSPLNSVAHGGGKLMHDVSDRVHGMIQTNRSKKKRDEKSGGAASRFNWSRAPQPSRVHDADDGDPD